MKIIFAALSILLALLVCNTAKCQSGPKRGLSIIKSKPDDKQEMFNVFPNPASSSIDLKTLKQMKGLYLEIFDQAGLAVVPKRQWNGETIDVSKLSDGIYLVRLGNAHENHVKKLIVLREAQLK